MIKTFEALVSAHKESVDAFAQFNTTLIGGLQEISAHACALAQNTVDLNVETGKAVAGVKSPQALAELHAKWMHQFFTTALSGTAKLSEISTKIAGQAAAPVQAHISTTVGRIADKVSTISGKTTAA